VLGQVTYSSSSSSGWYYVAGIVWATVLVLSFIAAWMLFVKAGQKGWKCLIPIYNLYILLKIVGRPGWWLLLFLIPFVNFVIWVVVMYDLSLSFGHGFGYALGLIFLELIFFLIIGLGESRYVGPGGRAATPPMPA